jgi:hypothetical protein
METVMVQYVIHPERAAEHEALIHGVFDELRAVAPAGFRYHAYTVDGGARYVHLASIDTPDGSNPLASLASFKRFLAGIGARCSTPPDASDLVVVDGFVA